MRKLLPISLFVAFGVAHFAHAQQDPQYTQYMYNQNIINPAYAGTQDNLTVTSLYRQQWSGVVGAPETLTVSGSTPIGERVGVGLSFINDVIGPVNEKNIYADFSYKLPVGAKTTLALGIKAGVTFHDVNLNTVSTTVPGDPLFQDQLNELYPNVGIGAFLYGDNWYTGLSVPNLIDSIHLEENDRQLGSETQHFFLTGGYVFDLNENVKFKPHTFVKGAFESPISFDLNANFLFNERFEVGAGYRLGDSFTGMFSVQLMDNLKVGYAYDRIVSDLNIATESSHEIFVTFGLAFPRKVMQSPRFF